MNRTLLLTFLLLLTFSVNAQLQQYFDGADTNLTSSIFIVKDTGSNNIWQIGKPQKVIFDSAKTLPNALVTDTINYYPPNNISSFSFRVSHFGLGNTGIVAIRWMQKLDIDTSGDGAMIEYTIDSGKTWKNALNNPQVYNFYGFNPANKDTLATGEYVLSGTDTTWRDIWLCFNSTSNWYGNDSIQIRYTLISDTSTNNHEGWMIDNMRVQPTYIHTVKHTADAKALLVYPTVTKGPVTVQVESSNEDHHIKSIIVMNSEGRLLKEYYKSDLLQDIDLSSYPNGIYYLKITTNKVSLSYAITLNK